MHDSWHLQLRYVSRRAPLDEASCEALEEETWSVRTASANLPRFSWSSHVLLYLPPEDLVQISALDGGDLLTMHDIWPLGFAFMFWIWITMAYGCLKLMSFMVWRSGFLKRYPWDNLTTHSVIDWGVELITRGYYKWSFPILRCHIELKNVNIGFDCIFCVWSILNGACLTSEHNI